MLYFHSAHGQLEAVPLISQTTVCCPFQTSLMIDPSLPSCIADTEENKEDQPFAPTSTAGEVDC